MKTITLPPAFHYSPNSDSLFFYPNQFFPAQPIFFLSIQLYASIFPLSIPHFSKLGIGWGRGMRIGMENKGGARGKKNGDGVKEGAGVRIRGEMLSGKEKKRVEKKESGKERGWKKKRVEKKEGNGDKTKRKEGEWRKIGERG